MRILLAVLALASFPLDANPDARAGEKKAHIAAFFASKTPVTHEAVN
jgi:hypothetical protein